MAAVADITSNAAALMKAAAAGADPRNAITPATDADNNEISGYINNDNDGDGDDGEYRNHNNSNSNNNNDLQDHNHDHDGHPYPYGPGVRPRVRLTHRPASAPSARASPSPARFDAAAMGAKVITDALDGTGGVEG